MHNYNPKRSEQTVATHARKQAISLVNEIIHPYQNHILSKNSTISHQTENWSHMVRHSIKAEHGQAKRTYNYHRKVKP